MKHEFYRLYLLLIIAGSVVIWSFQQIYNTLDHSASSHHIEVSTLINAYIAADSINDFTTMPNFRSVSLEMIGFPGRLAEKIKQGHTISLTKNNGQIFYYQQATPNQLIEFGPFESSEHPFDINQYLVILFYCSLALLLLIVIRPVFKDLQQLQLDAIKFTKQPKPITHKIRETSHIYPLANSFYILSDKVSNFVSMNESLSRAISHEVRTPLARMKFLLEVIANQISPQNKDYFLQDIKEIEAMIDDYLTFANIENNEQGIQTKQQNSVKFIELMEQKFNHCQTDHKIHFESDGSDIVYNEATLALACQTLLSNAIRYANHTIKVRFSSSDSHYKLSVSDDGPGFIDPDDANQNNFQRDSTGEQHKGFGIGLYIVKKVAIWHHGEFIISRSTSLNGAKMTIKWPISDI